MRITKCPNCGAPLKYKRFETITQCSYCGGMIQTKISDENQSDDKAEKLINEAVSLMSGGFFSDAYALSSQAIELNRTNWFYYLVRLASYFHCTDFDELKTVQRFIWDYKDFQLALHYSQEDEELYNSLLCLEIDNCLNYFVYRFENCESKTQAEEIKQECVKRDVWKQDVIQEAYNNATRCINDKIQATQIEQRYVNAVNMFETVYKKEDLIYTLGIFEQLGNYKNSKHYVEQTLLQIRAIEQQENKREKTKKKIIKCSVVSIFLIVCFVVSNFAIKKFIEYTNAKNERFSEINSNIAKFSEEPLYNNVIGYNDFYKSLTTEEKDFVRDEFYKNQKYLAALYFDKRSGNDEKLRLDYSKLLGEEMYATVHSLNIGDRLYYGKCEQDNNLDNGKEKIEWVVVEKTDSSITLASFYILDYIVVKSVSYVKDYPLHFFNSSVEGIDKFNISEVRYLTQTNIDVCGNKCINNFAATPYAQKKGAGTENGYVFATRYAPIFLVAEKLYVNCITKAYISTTNAFQDKAGLKLVIKIGY